MNNLIIMGNDLRSWLIDLYGGYEVELEIVDGRGDGLILVGVVVGVVDDVSDGLMLLGVVVGVLGEVNDEVEFGKYDCSLLGRLDLVFVLGSGLILFKGGVSCI